MYGEISVKLAPEKKKSCKKKLCSNKFPLMKMNSLDAELNSASDGDIFY